MLSQDNMVELLQYTIIVLVSLFTFTRVFRIGSGHILAVIVSALIVWYVFNRSQSEQFGFLSSMEEKLNALGNPSHFHHDADLINLFFSIRNWRNLNPDNFDQAVTATNNVLRLVEESRFLRKQCIDSYHVAKDLAQLSLNLVHGFIYNIEHQELVTKLENVLERLQFLLGGQLNLMLERCMDHEKRKGINVDSKFVIDSDNFKANDPMDHPTFDIF